MPIRRPSPEPPARTAPTIVCTFDKAITAAVVALTEGVGTAAAPTFNGSEGVVDLTGVASAQYVTLSLTGVASADGGSGGSALVRIARRPETSTPPAA